MARSTDSGRANSTFSDSECPVKTGTRTQVPDTSRSGMPRILRLSLRSFCSSSVSKRAVVDDEPAIGSTLKAIGATYFTGSGNVTADPSWVSSAALSTTAFDLAVELLDAGQPAAGHRLVGAGDDPDQPGLRRAAAASTGIAAMVVQFGLAMMPLRISRERLRVDLADDQRDVGVPPPGRAVVDRP